MFGIGFGLMEIVFPVMFIFVFGFIIFTMIKGIATWNKNNHSPRLTVNATVVSKRTNVSIQHHSDGGNMSGHTTSSTTYYVTFQVESGDRMEFHVSGSDYGMMAEGDRGKLNFQGMRFLSFDRM